MTSKKCFVAILAGMLFLISCSVQMFYIYGKDKIVFIDKYLAKKLKPESLSFRIIPDKTTEVQFTLRNISNKVLNFSYQMKFFDKNDFEISYPNLHWEPAIIYPHQSLSLKKILPDNRAYRVVIYIKK